jgi:hypothetical protein
MEDLAAPIDRELDRYQGVLKLRPNYVCRYYKSGGRLPVTPEQTALAARRRVSRWVPERWLASTVTALNADSVPGEGISLLDLPGTEVSLKQALRVRGEQIFGARAAASFGENFPVLGKVLDAAGPLTFQFHPRDEDVVRYPEHFAPNRFGKEEAYYFLPGPKGPAPYTHLGLFPGVSKEQLSHAIRKGTDYSLELSPAAFQRYEEGFHIPAGIPHRPGSALTLEIQQPSDACVRLDWFSGGETLSPEVVHPGFNCLEDALEFLDWGAAADAEVLEKNRIIAIPVAESFQPGNGEEVWIFPPTMTPKFSGKRVRVTGVFEMVERSAYVLLIWQGCGTLDGRSVAAGDEFFVSGGGTHRLERIGNERIEGYKLFPPEMELND